jgi:23S rRNA (adenine2503-C2)-methyltransferase
VNILEQILELDLPNFRKKQILHAIFKEWKLDFSQMQTIPGGMRETLQQTIQLKTLKLLKHQISEKKDTIKWSFLTSQNQPIESVLMLHKNGRRTICISCQSGCPVNCSFCWTGAMGFKQNLSYWEIIEQIITANIWLKEELKEKFQPINRVVFMGMGEPMINLIEVTKAINILLDPEYFGLGQRAITVSTSGYVPMMKKFWEAYPKIGLAVSLHAPNQTLREELMPVAKQFSLDLLIETCKTIQKNSKRRATYEYILIDGVTDTEKNAYELADLLEDQLAHVNLIPYNPIAGRDFKRPSRNNVMKFKEKLTELGISATARVTMGDDIKAACGQLSDHN